MFDDDRQLELITEDAPPDDLAHSPRITEIVLKLMQAWNDPRIQRTIAGDPEAVLYLLRRPDGQYSFLITTARQMVAYSAQWGVKAIYTYDGVTLWPVKKIE